MKEASLTQSRRYSVLCMVKHFFAAYLGHGFFVIGGRGGGGVGCLFSPNRFLGNDGMNGSSSSGMAQKQNWGTSTVVAWGQKRNVGVYGRFCGQGKLLPGTMAPLVTAGKMKSLCAFNWKKNGSYVGHD